MKEKSVVLMILVFCLFQGQLSPLITSRIQGVVKDAETGAVISNVKVYLFIYRVLTDVNFRRGTTIRAMTGKNGKFAFDDLKNNRYFVMCEHEDYLISPPEECGSTPPGSQDKDKNGNSGSTGSSQVAGNDHGDDWLSYSDGLIKAVDLAPGKVVYRGG